MMSDCLGVAPDMRGSLWLGPQSERRGRAFQARETSEAKVLCGMNGHAELKGITPGLLRPAEI